MKTLGIEDYVYLGALFLIVFILGVFFRKKRKRIPYCFLFTGIFLFLFYGLLAWNGQTRPLWATAYNLRANYASLDLASSKIFNNVFVSLGAIWLIGTYLWEWLLRDIAHDILKREDDNTVRIFFFSCLCLFTAQIIIGYRWPEFNIEGIIISSKMWGYIKHVLRVLVAVAPIGLSFYFCSRYWGYLEKDLKEQKFNDSIWPTLMVAQGTFYTFVGVSAILLIYTGNNNITELSRNTDITQILQGLKLAFLTSVIGLLFSVAARFKILSAAKEYYALKEKRVPLDEYDFYRLLSQHMLPVFNKTAQTLEHNNVLLESFGQNIVQINAMTAKEQTELFTRKIEEVFSALRRDMDEISAVSKEIRNDFASQKKETEQLIEKIHILGNTVPDLYTAAKGVEKAISSTAKKTASLASAESVQALPVILDNVKNLSASAQQLSTDITKLYTDSGKYIQYIAGNDYVFTSVAENAARLQDANKQLESQIQGYVGSLKQLNQLVGDAGLIELPSLLKDTASVTEKMSSITQNAGLIYSGIEANLENIKKSAEAASATAESVQKIAAANRSLSADITKYQDAIGKLNLPAIAATLSNLSAGYGNLEEIRTRDYEMLKNYNTMLAAQKEAIQEQISVLEKTIRTINLAEAGYVGTTTALANLAQRIHTNGDNIVGALHEVDEKYRKQSIMLQSKHFDALLEQQKKYLENLEKIRDNTMKASLDVTSAVLKQIKEELSKEV